MTEQGWIYIIFKDNSYLLLDFEIKDANKVMAVGEDFRSYYFLAFHSLGTSVAV